VLWQLSQNSFSKHEKMASDWAKEFLNSDYCGEKYPGRMLSTGIPKADGSTYRFPEMAKVLFKKKIDVRQLHDAMEKWGGYDGIQGPTRDNDRWITFYRDSENGPKKNKWATSGDFNRRFESNKRGAATLKDCAYRIHRFKIDHPGLFAVSADVDDIIDESSSLVEDPQQSAVAALESANIANVRLFATQTPNLIQSSVAAIPPYSSYFPDKPFSTLKDVFHDCSVALEQDKQVIGLLGRNGVGKSSLVNSILEISTMSAEDYAKENAVDVPGLQDDDGNKEPLQGNKEDNEVVAALIDDCDLVAMLMHQNGKQGEENQPPTTALTVGNLPCEERDLNKEGYILDMRAKYGDELKKEEFRTKHKLGNKSPLPTMKDYILPSSNARIQAGSTTRLPMIIGYATVWSFEVEYETVEDIRKVIQGYFSSEIAVKVAKGLLLKPAEKLEQKRIELLTATVSRWDGESATIAMAFSEPVTWVEGKTIRFSGGGSDILKDRVSLRNRMHEIVR
jgi:energy-coupling factor transporter ATP-binding protein EcfA2